MYPFKRTGARVQVVVTVLLQLPLLSIGAAPAPPGSAIQHSKEIWPTLVWKVRPKLPAAKTGGTDEERREDLARVVIDGYERYMQEILPKEFQIDGRWRSLYEDSDGEGGRENAAFLRWQKRAYSIYRKIRPDDLDWDGSGIPSYKGLAHDWAAFYGTKNYKALLKMVNHWCTRYMRSVERDVPNKWLIFPWAEVYTPGGHQPPKARTGAPAVGIYAAKTNGLQDFVFVDSRGVTPPYGQQHRVQLAAGDLLIFPAWAANFFTPNEGNSSNVYFRFWVQFPGGANDFDWEDDPLASFNPGRKNRLRYAEDPPAGSSPRGEEL